jgi:uncharacterized protein VcgC/VcgE DUF2780
VLRKTAVPRMDQLLAAAPAIEAKGAAAGTLGKKIGAEGLGSLAEVTQSFNELGLKPDMGKKAVPVGTDYIGKKGGGDLAKLVGDSRQ